VKFQPIQGCKGLWPKTIGRGSINVATHYGDAGCSVMWTREEGCRSVQDTDSRPTDEQAAADLEGPIDEEGMIVGLANGSVISAQWDWIKVGSKSLIESEGELISAPRIGSGVGSCGKRGQLGEGWLGGRE
jgi:hypothetical protein